MIASYIFYIHRGEKAFGGGLPQIASLVIAVTGQTYIRSFS
jgi:hypothetical protein